jgi:probable F420-dependent oxidoreductase
LRFGLFAINYGTCADPEAAVDIARHAEVAGFESVWTGEHIVLPDPQPPEFAIPPTLPFLDTVVALTLVAAHTTTIKIASGIILLPLRNPVVLAKELASLDVVSRGRLIVGVGVGYRPEEFAAAGVPLGERGERMQEYIAALRALWTMDRPRYHGRFISFSGIDAHPRPAQRPCPPIVVGAESHRAVRRAVMMANGWFGFSLDLAMTRRHLQALRLLAAERERPAELGRLEITVTPSGPVTRSTVERYEELGVDRLVLLPQPDVAPEQRHRPVPVEQIRRNVDLIAEQFLR